MKFHTNIKMFNIAETNLRFEQEIANANARIELLIEKQQSQEEKEKRLHIENEQLLQK